MTPLAETRYTLACLLLILSTTILAQAQSVDNAQQTPMQAQAGSLSKLPMHIVAFRDPNAKTGTTAGVASAPAGAHLSYYGGPVISNVHVVQVLYGSGSYLAQVADTTTPNIGTFFADLTGTNSGYTSLLTQYDTPASGGTGQTIGNGTFDGLFQIVPSPGNDGSTIDDTQIQAELLSQISGGHLPAPLLDGAGNVNTLYMIYFPPGKTITLSGSQSCVAGGFCAYHGTTSNTFQTKNLLYGVLPDFQSGGCAVGCGTSSVFGNYTSVSSHELSEAITDADVGIATTFAPPLAWYDMVNGEIGDICNGQQGSYVANGTTYTIQLEFSNAANNCVLPPPASTPNFTLSASPASLSVTQGSSGNSTITVTPSGGFTGSVTLSASGLPSGVTATFGTNPTTSTSVLTLAAASTATTGTFTVTITGTSGTLTHTTTISLTVNPAATPNFSLSASPSSVTVVQGNSGNTTISVTPSGGFTGSVTLSASGLPSGVTATFGTNPTTSTSVLTFTASASAATGTVTVTVTGTSTSPNLTHSTAVTLVVNTASTGNFSLSASPSSQTVTGGNSASYTATITPSGGFTGSVTLSVSGLPSGATARFSVNPVAGSGNSTLTVSTSSSTPTGSYTLTITGTSASPSLTHSTTVTLVVNSFSVSASPSSETVTRGSNATYTVTVTPINGFTGTVSFRVSGLPTNSTATFNPTSVMGGGTSTLTITTNSSTTTGTFSLRIRGTSNRASHSVTVQLIVQ